MSPALKDRVALITGAGSGIGREIAHPLGVQGAAKGASMAATWLGDREVVMKQMENVQEATSPAIPAQDARAREREIERWENEGGHIELAPPRGRVRVEKSLPRAD